MTPFTVSSPGATLSAFRGGDGSPLLLVMGVAGHHDVWGPEFVRRLTEQHDVVLYDHRGIGDSSWVSEPFTLDDLVDDALAVMDAAGWDDAHVLGFSMGGAVAQLLALREPSRVRTLTLLGTWGDAIDVWGDGVRLLADAGKTDDKDASLRMLFEANVSPEFAADPDHLAVFGAAAATTKAPTPVVMLQMPAAAAHDIPDRLGELDVPTLVVHGEVDRVVNVAAGKRLAAAIPGATFVQIDGCGHHVGWEAPERAASAVLKHTGITRAG